MEECLKAALKWWHEEASSLTQSVGDGDWDNVFDGDPEWVRMAKKALTAAPKPALPVDESDSKVLLKTQLVHLTRGDVNMLDGDEDRRVRTSLCEDKSVKELYEIYKSL